MRRVITIMLAAMLGLTIHAWGEALPEGVDPATGYRMDNYRAPTPSFLPGGVVADFALAEAASRTEEYRLVDVYAGGAVHDPIDGTWTNMDNRQQIPGSVWLPGIGAGALSKEQEAYFQRNLERLTEGDRSAGLMFYCMADCWQSWNAARRAIRGGYGKVAWYPLGTDGWLEQGKTLTSVTPENFIGTEE